MSVFKESVSIEGVLLIGPGPKKSGDELVIQTILILANVRCVDGVLLNLLEYCCDTQSDLGLFKGVYFLSFSSY